VQSTERGGWEAGGGEGDAGDSGGGEGEVGAVPGGWLRPGDKVEIVGLKVTRTTID